ncbi:UNVERIFIED_CONTAM: hypothetical protein NCL1_42498 [Trichonephila clavipes]
MDVCSLMLPCYEAYFFVSFPVYLSGPFSSVKPSGVGFLISRDFGSIKQFKAFITQPSSKLCDEHYGSRCSFDFNLRWRNCF